MSSWNNLTRVLGKGKNLRGATRGLQELSALARTSKYIN